jgi:argininosuccinate synthase
LAFNGDLESRLALHWLVHERGYEVVTLSINLGQGIYLEPLGELALDLGAVSARVIDRREMFLRDFALPVLQAGAVYQASCFLGSALARYVVAQEMVALAHEEKCQCVAHSAASKGNDQVRMETAIAAQDPDLRVLAPVRQWNLRSQEVKLSYARRHQLPVEDLQGDRLSVDRNLWGASIYLDDLADSWEEPPPEIFSMTQAPEKAPDQPEIITIGFESGVPCRINDSPMDLLSLVRELNQLGGKHAIGRRDVVEDRLFGIKSREFYEAPTPALLMAGHRNLESLVHSRELLQIKEYLSRRYAEVVYMGWWFSDLRRSLQGFFDNTQRNVTGDVRLKLYKGTSAILGRRSPHSLYDSQLASRSNMEWFDNRWAEGFTSLWTLPSRLAAHRQPPEPGPASDWAVP